MISNKFKIIIFVLIIFVTIILFLNKSTLKNNNLKNIQNHINISDNIPNYVWLYWENKNNKTTPNYIQLCRKSVEKNCSKNLNLIILDNININKYLPNLRKDINYLPIPQKVDYIRLAILNKYGGIYLDSDIILFKSLDYFINLLKYYDFIGFGSNSFFKKYKTITYGKISNWAMCSRKNGILISKSLDEANKILDSNKYINYHELGRELLWKQIYYLQKSINYKYYHYSSVNLERDLNGYKLTNDRFESNEKLDKNYNPYFSILYNSAPGFSNKFLAKTKHELLNSDMLISQLFRKALL